MAKKRGSKAKRSGNRGPLGGDDSNLDVFIESVDIEKRDRGGSRLSVSTDVTFQTSRFGAVEVIRPPFAIDDWALAPEYSTRLGASIFVKSRNTAGIGWLVVAKKKVARQLEQYRKELSSEESTAVDKLKKEIQREQEIVEDFLESVNPKKPFPTILRMVVADKEAVGNGYLEVLRSLVAADGKPKGYPIKLTRLIGHTIRLLPGGGFVQIHGSKDAKYFKEWGDERVIDNKTGKPSEDGVLLPPEQHATEIIHFLKESFRDTPYGVPSHLSTGPTLAGNRFAAERNANFFENDATPRMAIVVNGPYRLSKDSREDIKEFLSRKSKGVKNPGRVMVIQAGKREGSMTEKEDVKIDFHKLTVGQTEDGSYLKYQDRGDREISESLNLHPVFFEKDASRASANTGRSITLEQVFEPDIEEHEHILNNTIIPALGVKLVQLRLERPKTSDLEGRATILQKLQRTGGVTPNDIRDFLNKARFKENWGDVPLPLALQQLKVPEGRAEGSQLVDGLLNLNNVIEKAIRDRDYSTE